MGWEAVGKGRGEWGGRPWGRGEVSGGEAVEKGRGEWGGGRGEGER